MYASLYLQLWLENQITLLNMLLSQTKKIHHVWNGNEIVPIIQGLNTPFNASQE